MTTTSEDINIDGISTDNMLEEIPNLQSCDFEIMVGKSSTLFRLHWAEQVETLKGEPGGPVSYQKASIFVSCDQKLLWHLPRQIN